VGTTPPYAKKPFVSSILLWMRTDQPRQVGMDYWKGPHSKIISATPGFEEYRQIHLAENNPGLWPAISGVETVIPRIEHGRGPARNADLVIETDSDSLFAVLMGEMNAADAVVAGNVKIDGSLDELQKMIELFALRAAETAGAEP
jgi:hypothetical protein